MATDRTQTGKGRYHPLAHKFTDSVDFISASFGKIADIFVLAACAISAGNAVIRYLFNTSSNAWLEAQWYLFAGMVMLGAAHTLRKNEHVRVDIVYGIVSARTRLWIDIVGTIVFLLPVCAIMGWMTWRFFFDAFSHHEISANAGGLLRWPVKFVMPLGFALLVLQGLAELVKRIIALDGEKDATPEYERPLQ
ncbi:TRAP transporter small permease subunit [Lacibacterium aquatile]|uniref:TRAP transporter small permease protein n=1 Tax=Lacibacterium aquatile TaxID=1168082 RepID=A0ABW5DP10_9PROT